MMESMGYEGRPEKRARLTLLGEGDRGNGIHEVGTFSHHGHFGCFHTLQLFRYGILAIKIKIKIKMFFFCFIFNLQAVTISVI
jgi:hypothetical protein